MTTEQGAQTARSDEVEAKLKRLQQMLAVDPRNQSLRQHLFDTALAAKRFDFVKSEAELILASDPNDALARFNLANAFIGSQRYEQALESLRVLQQAAPDEVGIRLNIALCHYCLRDYDRARPLLESCYGAGVRTADALRLLISSYHHLGLVDEAVAIANDNAEAATSNPALAGIYALLYIDADDIVRAARWTKTALELNPDSIEGRLAQSTLLTARMETEKARAVLESLVREAPQLGRAWIGLGTLDLLAQDLPTAKQRLARGLELMPTHVGSWHVLAWAQLLSGELDAAEENFNRALDLDRNFAETHGGLASVAAIRGEKIKAEHLIDVALRLDQDCLSAKFAQSVLVGNAGDSAKARQNILDTAATLSAKDGSALSRLLSRAAKGKPLS